MVVTAKVKYVADPEEEVKDLSLSQPFNMESACGIPEYTNYTVSFAACLDYIFYQTDRLNVEAVSICLKKAVQSGC